jgi:DNA-binding MarR family transcriptional regulator
MARQAQFEELLRQLSAVGAVKRELGRQLPPECPPGSAAVLTLLGRHGDMRLSRLAELAAVDISVCSRHVSHVADRGWVERLPDPDDKRSRLLHLTTTSWWSCPTGRPRCSSNCSRTGATRTSPGSPS